MNFRQVLAKDTEMDELAGLQELQELLCEEDWDLDSIADWVYAFLEDDYIPADENTRIKNLPELKGFSLIGCTLEELVDWANDFLNFYFDYLNDEGEVVSLFHRLTDFSLN